MSALHTAIIGSRFGVQPVGDASAAADGPSALATTAILVDTASGRQLLLIGDADSSTVRAAWVDDGGTVLEIVGADELAPAHDRSHALGVLAPRANQVPTKMGSPFFGSYGSSDGMPRRRIGRALSSNRRGRDPSKGLGRDTSFCNLQIGPQRPSGVRRSARSRDVKKNAKPGVQGGAAVRALRDG